MSLTEGKGGKHSHTGRPIRVDIIQIYTQLAYSPREYLYAQDPDLGSYVAAQLFGHIHACEFRLLSNATNPGMMGPILLSGALRYII